jgi:hypothetical protein
MSFGYFGFRIYLNKSERRGKSDIPYNVGAAGLISE